MHKKCITISLIIVVVMLGLLGLFSMSLAGDNHMICPVSIMMPSNCSSASHELASIIHHITLIKLLTQGNISTILFVLSALFLFSLFLYNLFEPQENLYKKYFFLVADKISICYKKFTRWLNLQANSDYITAYKGT